MSAFDESDRVVALQKSGKTKSARHKIYTEDSSRGLLQGNRVGKGNTAAVGDRTGAGNAAHGRGNCSAVGGLWDCGLRISVL